MLRTNPSYATSGTVILLAALLILLSTTQARAQSRIFNAEIQAVGSWESVSDSLRPYSMHPQEAMQRPSLGFDLIQRFGNSGNDWGYLSLQGRLAYDSKRDSHLEAQLYNAYLNFKFPLLDTWLGHNKPALGLSSVADNHAQILMDNTMSGLVPDRDWGLGVKLDRSDPGISASLTTGSGMSLYWDKSYLLSVRAALGDYSRQNIAGGISLAAGNTFKTMGYTIMHNKVPHELLLTGADFSARVRNLELRADALYGSYHGSAAYTALARFNWYPLPEDRAEVSLQGQVQEIKATLVQNLSVGLAYRILPALTVRTSYNFRPNIESHSIALQLYYYQSFLF